MRRALQAVIALLSLLPLGVGSLGFIHGAGWLAPAAVITPRLDSQFRFMSALDVGLALMAWWIIPRVDRQTTLFRLVCLVVFVGGVGRGFAWIATGWPGWAFATVTLIELLIPLLIPWQAQVAKHARAGTAASSGA